MAIEFQIKGIPFTISDDDADLLTNKWKPTYSNRGKHSERIYAGRTITRNHKYVECLLLHRVILSRMLERDLVKGECVDHIDRDSTNNQRENLRLATYTENAVNRKLRIDNKTGFKGVTLQKNNGRYIATIWIKRRHVYLGTFDTSQEAHAAYLVAAKENYGDFARGENSNERTR